MSRIQVSKLNEFVVLGSPADTVTVSKLNVYFILEPGDDGSVVAAAKQGFCYGQRIGAR